MSKLKRFKLVAYHQISESCEVEFEAESLEKAEEMAVDVFHAADMAEETKWQFLDVWSEEVTEVEEIDV